MKLPISTTKIGSKLSRKQWMILAVILLVIAAGIGYYVWQRNKKRKLSMANTGTDGEAKVIAMPTETKLFSDCPNDSFPLKYGKCGKRVEQFQLFLIKQYGAQFSTYGVDGRWGDETEAIAKKFILKNAPFSISEEYFNKLGMFNYKTLKYA